MLTPNPIHTALEVLRADRQALIDCHSSGAGIPSDDELALQALAQYDQAIKGLESMLRKLQDLRQYDQAINGPQDLQAHFGTLPSTAGTWDRQQHTDAAQYALDVLKRNQGKQARLRAIERLEAALAAADPAAAVQSAQPAGEPVAPPNPLHDPRLQELFLSCITGVMACGYQGVFRPPAGHWLTAAWDIGRAEAESKCTPPAAARVPLTMQRVIAAAQAVTTGCDDKIDTFEVPSHLMAALALALDDATGQEGGAA
jgi:hypothetical protein